MPVLTTGKTYIDNDQVTASNLNEAVNGATFAAGAVDGSTTQLSGGAIIVRDGGITLAKSAPMPANTILGNPTAGSATPATIACTAVGRAVIGAADAPAQRTALGLGTAAVEADTKYAHRANNLSDLASAATARTNLGATTVGGNLFTLGNPSAIRFLRLNANNTASALNAADFLTAIGAGSGTGTIGGSTGATADRVLVADGTGGSTLKATPIQIDGSGNVDNVANLTASGVFNTTSEYRVSGTKVLGAQQAAEGNVSSTVNLTGGDTVSETATVAAINALENKVNNLLAKLRTHGIIAT